MSINEPEEKKRLWFGPKRNGYGYTPRTWQGWLYIVVGVAAQVAIAFGAPHLWPAWYVARANGQGWNAVGWQGYAVALAPAAVVLAGLWYVFRIQRKG